jgi:hypothetical protein
VAELLFELIRAGNLFLYLNFKEESPVVVSPEQQRHLAGHLPEALVLGSPAELHRWLADTIAEWQRERRDWFKDDQYSVKFRLTSDTSPKRNQPGAQSTGPHRPGAPSVGIAQPGAQQEPLAGS